LRPRRWRVAAQIAVLDVMMPRLNGLDVLRHIRRESTLPVADADGAGAMMQIG